MAAIPGKNTTPELTVRRALHATGFRYRLHRRDIPGTPDIVLPRYRLAVLVHGCYWHGHACKTGHIPRTNGEYWSAKISRNRERDARNGAALEERGWSVCIIRECSLRLGLEELLDTLRLAKSKMGQS